METKDQLNQNPGDVIKQSQEENSKSVKKTEDKLEEKQQPVEDQEKNSKKKPSAKSGEEKKPSPKKVVKKSEKAPATSEKKEKKPAVKKANSETDKAKTSAKTKKTTKKSVTKSDATKKVKEKVAKVKDSDQDKDKSAEKVKKASKTKKPVKKAESKTDVEGDTSNEKKKALKKVKKEVQEEVIDQEANSEELDEKHEADLEVKEHQEVENLNELPREELVVLLEDIVRDGDINAIKKKVALIKVAFLKINKEEKNQKYDEFITSGGDKTDYDSSEDEFEKRFNEAFGIYRQKRQIFLEDLEKQKTQNLEAKKIILEELKALIDSEESLKKTYDEFRTLQDKWRQIGMVPKNEVNNLWQSYHFFVEKFFDKVKINKELRDLDLKKNLESKIRLCEKTEELLLETSILKSFKQLQKYHNQWKQTGPVPQDKKDEIWDRFKSATDKINQRRREHYEKLQEGQNNNYIAKTALCEKSEEILQKENENIKDWQENTEQISELLKVWKTIGPAPRKQNDEIWERFKTSLDTFFTGRKEYFQKIKEEQLNNYNFKLDLCAQAEAVKNSTDWKRTTQELIHMQKEWKKIGPVPKKYSDKVWKRFRAACDEFFNSKSEYYANIGKHESDNLKLKEELIEKVEKYKFSDDKNGNLETLKEFQREWTDIGHVPIRDKDRVQIEFRNTI
ncbi:MAG: DUF349 domain-containing protein, partial [Bacteroidales bacterium]|nr:DUF349 domain-containing protein [Bacteroidales bacterium]